MGEFKRISRREMLQREEDKKTQLQNDKTLSVSNEISRGDIIRLGDAVFLDSVLFNFDNNRLVNAVFVNDIQDREFSDFAHAHNIEFNKQESCISLIDPTAQGIYFSTKVATDSSRAAVLNDLFLMADESVPEGTDILYFIVTNNGDTFPIKPNHNEPLRFTGMEPVNEFRIKAVITPNGGTPPQIRGLAVLYFDDLVNRSLGLINPDLGTIDEELVINEDVVTLIRDNTQEDRLIQVVSLVDDIKLTYAEDGELRNIDTFDSNNGEKKAESMLVYGDYLTSEGIVERVLHQVRSKTMKNTIVVNEGEK